MRPTHVETMRLLHDEIEVVPGRQAQHPVAENQVGPGSAILRLVNTTSQENAYIVSLQCDDPNWRQDWYTLQSVAAPTEGGNAAARGEKDEAVADNSFKVYISRGATRDIQINFYLDYVPASRAGIYHFNVKVKTLVASPVAAPNGSIAPNGSNAPHLQGYVSGSEAVFPARAIVRPFYKWQVALDPAEGIHVGRMLRRSGEFEVRVINEGNDWLYCDLQLPLLKDVLLHAPTLRVAVPPPEPGELQLQRDVPLRATTRLKAWVGNPVAQPIPLSAVRLEAPSVLFHPEAAQPGAAPPGTVVATLTQDMAQARDESPLIYDPPISARLTSLVAAMAAGGKASLMTAIALMTTIVLGVFMYEQIRNKDIVAEPLSAQVAPDGKLILGGRHLLHSKIFINGPKGQEEAKPFEPNNHFPGKSKSTTPPGLQTQTPPNETAQEMLQTIEPEERQFVTIKVDKKFNGQKITLMVQREGIFPFLSPLLPKYACHTEVQVGAAPVPIPISIQTAPIRTAPIRTAATGGKYPPGAVFQIRLLGPPLSTGVKSIGVVGLGGLTAPIKSWSAHTITALIPPTAPPGIMPVTVILASGEKWK